jgi:hypothetical protein
LGLREKKLELTDSFQPGPLGITYWPKTGLVTEVFEGGQAQRHGVQVGWFVESIAGEPYSHKTFVTYRHHDKPYSVTFVSRSEIQNILTLEELDLPPDSADAGPTTALRCVLSIPDGVRASAVYRNLEKSHRQGRLIDVCMNCGTEIPIYGEDVEKAPLSARTSLAKSGYCITCRRAIPQMAADPPETLRVRKVEPVDLWVIISEIGMLIMFPFLLDLKQIHDMLLNGCFWLGGILLTLLLMSLTLQVRDLRRLPKEIKETLAHGYKTDGYLNYLAKSCGLWGFLVLGVTSYGFQWQVEQADQFIGALLCMLFRIYGLTTYVFEFVFLKIPALSYLQPRSSDKHHPEDESPSRWTRRVLHV